jgi:acyl-CoA synthetase (AMP-forming)/AMP-acid ligase II
MIADAFEHGLDTVVGGWLPLYHDMGLIGNVLQSVWLGRPCYLSSPFEFMQRPLRWLEMISRYRVTTSGAPNFAYDACVRRIDPRNCSELDLRSWTLAFNGAEPVRWEVLERFAARFQPWGFDRRAFYPCYGLAEATLFVTGPRRTTITAVDVDHDRLEQEGQAVEPAEGKSVRKLVGCGFPRLGATVKIVNPETHKECVSGGVGEIWVSGPSVAEGYWQSPDSETFGAIVADDPSVPYLRTGDLGFVRDGELFVTGRLRDMVIVRGRNHYAEDIEATVEGAHAFLAGHKGAAFAVATPESEALVVVQEVSRQHLHEPNWLSVREAVVDVLAQRHGLAAREIVFVLAGSLPRTTSGKVKRFAVRQHFLEGSLHSLEKRTESRRVA